MVAAVRSKDLPLFGMRGVCFKRVHHAKYLLQDAFYPKLVQPLDIPSINALQCLNKIQMHGGKEAWLFINVSDFTIIKWQSNISPIQASPSLPAMPSPSAQGSSSPTPHSSRPWRMR